jgi:6,7-dimethyl-8-ribityllumazine synthase
MGAWMSKEKVKHQGLRFNSEWVIGIVTSRFNEKVTAKLREGAIEELIASGASEKQITAVWVPGAFEIPLAAKWLIEKQKCDAVIATGAVIRGETSHYDTVCNAVERGCTMLQLESGKPVVFGVLTTENEEQALNRAGGSAGHKGKEAVQTLIEMLLLKKCLKPQKNKKNKGRKHGH